jgi:hypothetical protein
VCFAIVLLTHAVVEGAYLRRLGRSAGGDRKEAASAGGEVRENLNEQWPDPVRLGRAAGALRRTVGIVILPLDEKEKRAEGS